MEDHICALARQEDAEAVLIIAPRLLANVLPFEPVMPVGKESWGKTALVLPDGLPGDTFKNVLTGEEVEVSSTLGKRLLPMAALFSFFPVAMLETAKELKKERT